MALGTAAAAAPGLESLAKAAAVAALGMLNVDGVTSNPSFFMSRVTMLKDSRRLPCDLTLVTVKRNQNVIVIRVQQGKKKKKKKSLPHIPPRIRMWGQNAALF